MTSLTSLTETSASMIVDFGNTRFCVFARWDNGEIEKLSPWDVEPIPDDGK